MTQSLALMLPQIGVETTEGTPVAATRKLQALSIEPNFDVDIGTFTPYGIKVPTLAWNNRSDRIAANITGQPTYNEIVYALASMITNPTPTQPDVTNAPNTYAWSFIPNPDGNDSPATYTTEIVGPDRSYRFGNGLVNTFNLTAARSPGGGQMSMGGSMFGQGIEDGVTPSPGATAIATLTPMIPTQFSLYIDDDAASLGTTLMDETFQVAFDHPAKYMAYEALDASVASFQGHFEVQHAPTLAITLERNSDASALIAAMRSSDKKFIRLEGVGPTIEDVQTYKFTLDFCGRLTAPSMGNQDQLATVSYTFTNMYDATWDQSLQIDVVNDLATL